MTASQLLHDPQLWARNFYQVLDREETGAHPYPGPFVRLSATPATFDRPAPSYGQHTAEILRERLGLTEPDLAALEAAGVTSREPAAQDWR
jgi:crotonobetainyl-CoA:carnitine CoA-transferase CaiB-like acyl-CoA transferase